MTMGPNRIDQDFHAALYWQAVSCVPLDLDGEPLGQWVADTHDAMLGCMRMPEGGLTDDQIAWGDINAMIFGFVK